MTDTSDTSAGSQRDRSRMALAPVDVWTLFSVFALALVASAVLLVSSLLTSVEPLTEVAILQILGEAAVCGATMYYARKLYKAGINRDYDFSATGMSVHRLSTIAYYLLRLPSAVIIAFVVYALWRLSVHLAGDVAVGGSEASKYLFLIMGFFSGFSAGRFIEFFEREGFRLASNDPSSDDSSSN